MSESMRRNILNLSRTISLFKGEMMLALLFAFLKQASIIGAAMVTSYAAGEVIKGGTLQNPAGYVVILCVCILLRAAGYYGEMYFAHDVAFRVIRGFRLKIYNKLGEIAPAYTMRKQTGQIAQAFVADVEILELFLAHTFSSFLVAVILTAVMVIVLLFINPLFSVMVLIVTLLLVAVPYRMGRKAEKRGQAVRESLSDANVTMVESVQGLRELTMLGAAERRLGKINRRMEEMYGEQYEYGRLKGREVMATQIICGLFTAAVLVAAAMLVGTGRLELVLYPVTVMLSTVILGPVLEFTTVAQELGIVFAASNRVQDLLRETPAVSDKGTAGHIEGSTEVEFRDVCFRYNDESDEVLHGVSFTVSPGETVVLVGRSGAGKSTCANLLLRYWDPDSGQILLNGRDIREYSISALREMVSAASQETYLFHTSVAENIRMGKPDSGMEEIISAARRANADEFVRSLPQGYDTVTGERGFRLSGGQRQRIAIARTLLRDSSVIILDESVSNLDAENELYMQRILSDLLRDKTVIMIAHRLSTILSADRIVLIDGGRVAATGTHSELLETCPEYAELISRQLKSPSAKS